MNLSSAYEESRCRGLTWVNNVMARLLNVPDEVKSYNDTITQLLANAKTAGADLRKLTLAIKLP